MTLSRNSKEARNYKEDFISRVESEFGTQENLDETLAIARAETEGDRVYLQKEVLATSLAREGYLITPHVGRVRFTAQLAAKDVGLDDNNPEHKEFINNYLSLGNKLLLPAQILAELNKIEGRIRRIVAHKYGIPTYVGTFIPYKMLDEMKYEVEELKTEYFNIRNNILANYDSIYHETEIEYRRFAVKVYRLIKKDPHYEPTEKEVEQFVHSTMSCFPSKSAVRDSFYVTLDVGVVTMTAELLEHEKRLELVNRAAEKYEQEIYLLEKEVSEAIRLQQHEEQQKLLIQKEEYKTKLMAEQKKQTAIRSAINEAKERYIPQMQELIADLSGAVHGIVYDAVSKASDSISRHGSLTSGSSKSLRTIIEQVERLCVESDPEVEGWIHDIRQIIDIPAYQRDKLEVKSIISQIQHEAGSVILEMGAVPRTLRNKRKVTIGDIEREIANIPLRPRQARSLSLFDEVDEDTAENMTPIVRAKRAC